MITFYPSLLLVMFELQYLPINIFLTISDAHNCWKAWLIPPIGTYLLTIGLCDTLLRCISTTNPNCNPDFPTFAHTKSPLQWHR